MEVMCHAELVADPLPYEVPLDAMAARVLRDVCALFGRADKDMALEVDGVVVYMWGGEDVEVGSLGLHADSSVVVQRSRERVLALVAGRKPGKYISNSLEPFWTRAVPKWAWDDAIMVSMMIKKNACALQFASAKLRSDPAVVTEAVRQNGMVLQYASAELRNDASVVTEAVEASGWALQFASPELRNDPDLVAEAVRCW